jgi:hypothetical protein
MGEFHAEDYKIEESRALANRHDNGYEGKAQKDENRRQNMSRKAMNSDEVCRFYDKLSSKSIKI